MTVTRTVIAAVAAIGVIIPAGCSETYSRETRDGVCVVRDEHHVFGLPFSSSENPCDEDE